MSGISGHIVIDQTGIEAIDITINLERPPFTGDGVADIAAVRDSYFASMVGGVNKMGLKVASRNGPLEVLMVDSAERPREN